MLNLSMWLETEPHEDGFPAIKMYEVLCVDIDCRNKNCDGLSMLVFTGRVVHRLLNNKMCVV